MGFLTTLLNVGAQIGTGFMAAELQRKEARAQARVSMVTARSISSNGAAPSTRRVGGAVAPRTTTGEPVLSPGAWTDRRQWKAALCRAVKRQEIHPAQANALLKMEGLKGCTRRMNPLNPRALTRAARRMEGFLRTVKRIERAIPTKTRKVRAKADHHHHPIRSTGPGSA